MIARTKVALPRSLAFRRNSDMVGTDVCETRSVAFSPNDITNIDLVFCGFLLTSSPHIGQYLYMGKGRLETEISFFICPTRELGGHCKFESGYNEVFEKTTDGLKFKHYTSPNASPKLGRSPRSSAGEKRGFST